MATGCNGVAGGSGAAANSGPMLTEPTVPSSKVRGPDVARATSCRAIWPAAPGRFSTMVGTPSVVRLSATRRAIVVGTPPAA